MALNPLTHTNVNLVVPKELKKVLQERIKITKRSLSAECVYLLEIAVKAVEP